VVTRLATIVALLFVQTASAQTRVAIPRASLTTPDQPAATSQPAAPATAGGQSGFGQFRSLQQAVPLQTFPMQAAAPLVADNRTSVAAAAGTTPAAAKPVGTLPSIAATAPNTITANTTPAASTPAATTPAATPTGVQPIEPLKDIATGPRRSQAKVTQSTAVLPNEAGQVWREYDITPYTARVTTTNRPEQSIVDWILRETGYESWHSEPLGILSATPKTVRVYHTPETQAIVADVIDRFVSSEAESQAFGLHVVTVSNPNWRINAQRFMQPVAVQTQGIQAWVMRREDAALVLSELRRRGDFREHSNPQMIINNGQSGAVSAVQPKQYVRNVIARQSAVGVTFENEAGQFDEGFALELNPLLSLDNRSIDAVLKCQIDQLERLVPVMLDAPTPLSPRQRLKVEVPQATHFRLHERFRWPADQVLVVGLGMVATPTPQEPNALLASLPLVASPPRADLLVFIETRGKIGGAAALPLAAPAATPAAATTPTAARFGGRY